MKNISDSLDEVMQKLDEIKAILEGPSMWEHSCPAMGTELTSVEKGYECNYCGARES